MTIQQADKLIDSAAELAVGDDQETVTGGMSGTNVLSWLTSTGQLLPPWWSRARDRRLGKIWKESNHLSLAVYNTQAKIVSIPFEIRARDRSNPDHILEAEQTQFRLMISSEFGRSWHVAYSKFIEDLLTQDNGAFMEVIGPGEADGPIVGMPVSVRHLDSARCTRTGNFEFPVLYTDRTGHMFKMHWTRVIYTAQMPSARAEMNGVGFSAVSRSVDIAQTLIDMVRYKQERLGSRPHNQLLVGKGITANQIMQAFRMATENLDNKGLERYAKTIAVGSESPDIGIEKIDLVHMEPFNEEVSTNLGMFAIASAFGMDADELWPTGGGSSSKADASIRRMRTRGRLPAQITSEIATQFSYKLLPGHLVMKFDFKDDEEDQQRAVIRDIRGRNRERDLSTGAINIRAARSNMLRDGDVDQLTFDQMELSDGRMPDGKSIGAMFYSSDQVMTRLIGSFMDNPIAILDNIRDEEGLIDDRLVDDVIAGIQNQRALLFTGWNRTTSVAIESRFRVAFYALDWLEEQYNFAAGRLLPAVPMQQRRLRQDIRVVPEENAPDPGEVSAAQSATSGSLSSENIAQGE